MAARFQPAVFEHLLGPVKSRKSVLIGSPFSARSRECLAPSGERFRFSVTARPRLEVRMLVRALKLQLTGEETLVGALNALVTQKWAANVVNGQTILSTSEAGGSVTFTFERAYTPAELAMMAEEALEWVNTLVDPENPPAGRAPLQPPPPDIPQSRPMIRSSAAYSRRPSPGSQAGPSKPARPQTGDRRPAVTPVRHYFEALNTVDHRTPIPATGFYVHRLLSKFNRLQLASVARYLWDNVGLVFYATDLVANYSTPMVPRAATLDRKWNEAANGYFDDWAERADFTGRFDFWDLQRLGSFYLDTDGEVFALWTDEAGFPQLQLLESWRIDKPTVADDRIFDGVQLDTQGRVLGYWLDGKPC